MGASFAMGRQSLRRRGQPTKCRRSGLRPPTRGGSAREHLAEEVAVVPARPFGRVADQLADARVQARHARGVAVLDRLAVGVVAGTVVAVAQAVAQRPLRRSDEHTSELKALMRYTYD